MNYSLNPTSKLNYFGHVGEHDGTIQFKIMGEFSLCCPGTNKDLHNRILNPNSSIMREFMTDATFEGKDRKKMKEPNFLFGDKIELLEDCLLTETTSG